MYVPLPQRDDFNDYAYLYWITYDTTTDTYTFNSNQDDGTVTIFYNFLPADLTTDAGVCVVPDMEAVAYLAAAKHWISDERNEELAKRFETEAKQRIQAMYIQDLNYGPQYSVGTPVDYEVIGRHSSGL
jgi:uncharacterized protein YjiK